MDYIKELSNAISSEQSDNICKLFVKNIDNKNGDFSLPCFTFAKTLRQSPQKIAETFASKLTDLSFVDKVEVVGGYLNVFIKQAEFAREVLDLITTKGDDYGASDIGNEKTICIDFSSINIAKPFHIGHLSTTVIGNSLYKIYQKLGYKVVGINHLGDYGTQFGKLICAYKRYGNFEEVEKNNIKALLALYIKFHEQEEKDPSLTLEAREYFRKIENGDEECVKLFEWFKKLTLTEVDKIYKLLKVKFDSYDGESFYSDKMQPVIDELVASNLLTESEGAKVVDLEKYSMPPCLIKKADGASLYATRDLAAIFYRKKTYDFYKCLYVVAYQQNLHFRQVFQVVKLMGYDYDLEHIAFGMVSLENSGSLSTRKGNVVFLEEVLNSSIQKAKEIILTKSGNIQNIDATAQKIGVGAVIFSALANNRIKDIVFSFEKVLSFEGETAPYIQYTYARAISVLEKATYNQESISYENFSDIENSLIKLLASFPETIVSASEKNEPCFISRLLIDICKTFNKFYYECRIIGSENQNARLLLVRATAQVIKNGLALLSIDTVDKM